MRLRIAAIGAVAAVLSIAALAFVSRQGPADRYGWADDDWGPMGPMVTACHRAGELPPALAFLQQIPPGERFDRFRGATMTVTDRTGTPVVVNFTPGTVTAVSPTSITVMPNGESVTRAFDLTPKTFVQGVPNPGSLQAVVSGDKVIVVTVGQSAEAVVVLKYPMPRRVAAQSTATPVPAPAGSPTPTR